MKKIFTQSTLKKLSNVTLFFVVLLHVSVAHSISSPLAGVDLRNMQKVTVDLNQKTNVLIFLSARCPCSESHEDLIKEVSNKFKEFNFVGIHSNSDEPVSEAHPHFKEKNFPFPVISDPESILANSLKALKTPHMFILNSTTIVYSGGVTDSSHAPNAKINYLQDTLLKIQKNQEFDKKITRTLGCTIARPST